MSQYQSPFAFGKVAVLMGGWAGEREVSLTSGKAVLQGLLDAGVDAVGVDVDRNIAAVISEGGFDRAFNIVHGPGGEDGVLQGVLESLQLPYTGSAVLASAMSMNKLVTKRLWSSAGVATPEFEVLAADSDFAAVAERLGLPLMIKPACEGSSLGMSRVTEVSGLQTAYALAAATGDQVFAERWVQGREFTIGILKGEALPVIELRTNHEFYDFDAKYLADDTQYLYPVDLAEQEQREMSQTAEQAFHLLGAEGWGRVDVMRDESGKSWFIELNSVPGMTNHSLVPMAAQARGMCFSELVCEVLSTTLQHEGAA